MNMNFFKSEEQQQGFIYTEEQLMARLKFFIGVCLSLTLTGIVFVVLYSLIFVTQPLNAISPIDQKFFELIVPIATFLTGTLSGIMLSGQKKEDQEAFLASMKQSQSTFESFKAPPAPVTPVTQAPRPMAPMAPQKQDPVFAEPQAQVVVGFGGKPAPAPAPQPEI
jgi:hypothetical protein